MRLMSASVLLAALSCGGGGPTVGSATSTGSIRGQSLAPRDATAGTVAFSANGVAGRVALIAITSAPGICSMLAGGKEPRSTQYLVLAAFRLQPDYSPVPPPSPGTYPVGALTIENAVARFAATDANCQLVGLGTGATDGSITFTSVGNRYAGSYDLTFESGDRVTGTFDAPVCGGVSELDPGAGTLACQ